MSRISDAFDQLKANQHKAFIPFITAGYPDLETTEQLVYGFEEAGVTLVELGVPFSDPLADGPTIQQSSQQALDQGVTLNDIFELVKKIRQRSQIPLALMMYYNQIFHYGESEFIQKVKQVGVDGLIIPDLPPEEAETLMAEARAADIDTVFFIAPTSSDSRLPLIIKSSTGFLYCVSITGVTGARTAIPDEVFELIDKVKTMGAPPVCLGFGVSTPDHVRDVCAHADGVIVGSAIIKMLDRDNIEASKEKVFEYIRSLIAPIRSNADAC